MSKRPDDQLQAAFDAARAEAEPMPSDEQVARARAQFLSAARGENVSPNGVARLTEQEGALPELTIREEKRKMKGKTSRVMRMAAAVLLGVILAGGLVWASPSLRALAQEIISFIVPVDDEQASVVFVHGDTVPDWMSPATWSLEEIVTLTDFDMRVPTFMPETYQFTHASYVSYGATPVLYYECRFTPWSIMIWQTVGDENPSFEVGESAVIETASIHDTIGQYVRGFWSFHVDDEVRSEREAVARELDEAVGVPATMMWSNEINHQQLTWREDGIVFTIKTATMTSDGRNPCPLTKEDYIAIAEGLRPASQVAQYAAISHSRNHPLLESTNGQSGR